MLNVYQKRWIASGVGATVAAFLLGGLVKDQPLDKDKMVITRRDLVKLMFAGGLSGLPVSALPTLLKTIFPGLTAARGSSVSRTERDSSSETLKARRLV